MLEELQRRNLSAITTRIYLHSVEEFAKYFNTPPDRLGLEHVRKYQAHRFTDRKLEAVSVAQQVSALRFFYLKTLKRPWPADDIPAPKRPIRLPGVLSREEVERLIESTASPLHRITEDAVVQREYFSQTGPLTMRENYSITVSKTIYERLKFPSNEGGHERAFIEFCDADVLVKTFIKVDEHLHKFARIIYNRDDGILAPYYPDFIVKLNGQIHIVETKAESQLKNPNVLRKRKAAVDFCDTINKLKPEDRDECTWHYCLLGESDFYSYRDRGANIKHPCHRHQNESTAHGQALRLRRHQRVLKRRYGHGSPRQQPLA